MARKANNCCEDNGTIGTLNGKWALLLKMLLAVSIPFYCWLCAEAFLSMQFRARTSANIWTAQDQAQFQKELFAQQTMLFAEITRSSKNFEGALEKHRESDHPPKWFADEVKALAQKVETSERLISEIRSDVSVIKAAVVRE